ncbi:nardilysin-like protein [Cucumis melo var. makuwa]|uniref:Nardilysin-like protein n=1 Tax=Cucumis melo var. makuwa TaxID=1194695 RepID=A0A5A7U2B1_CUCMM|nr:nardilysin-like protein [Cucumis melo var. makuwa]
MEYIPHYSSSSSDSDSTKKSYAKALSEGSDDNNRKRYKSSFEGSSSKRSSNHNHSAFSLSGKSFDTNVIITGRCFHDDWGRIMFSLKKQPEIEFSYNPFQVDKAILSLAPEHAKLLCSNRNANGWSTVGNYQVKFESWNTNTHSFHSVIPSYGDWLRFRGIPLHLWNYNTFHYIRMACGGFFAVAKETLEQEKLIDVKIEVRYNYTSFVPANIVISDEFGDNFIINTVQHPEARWLVERSVRVHSSFKTKVTEEFDEHNPLAEAYTYNGFQVIPPESSKFFSGHLHNNSDKHSYSNPTKAKNDSSSNS